MAAITQRKNKAVRLFTVSVCMPGRLPTVSSRRTRPHLHPTRKSHRPQTKRRLTDLCTILNSGASRELSHLKDENSANTPNI